MMEVLDTLSRKERAMKRGTQIVYVPSHASGINHPDCEEGFVTSIRGNTVFCRYWSKVTSGIMLRTRANSEGTPIENIVVCDTHPQSTVDEWLRICD